MSWTSWAWNTGCMCVCVCICLYAFPSFQRDSEAFLVKYPVFINHIGNFRYIQTLYGGMLAARLISRTIQYFELKKSFSNEISFASNTFLALQFCRFHKKPWNRIETGEKWDLIECCSHAVRKPIYRNRSLICWNA